MKKYINQADMKKTNTADIFSLIRRSGAITRKEIEAKTGLSWGAVSTITANLLENNYIKEIKYETKKSAGRTPSHLEVNGDQHFVLGVDINISGFKAGLVNLKNEVTANSFYKATYKDKDSLLDEIIKFIRKSTSLAKDKSVIGIGIAIQGMVDAQKGISVSFPHCEGWQDVPLAQILTKEFNVPVFIEHDPNCILYAVSSEQLYKDALLFRVDKGVGMSVLMNGKILDRPGMFEIGHAVMVPGGQKCSCGKCGCLEAYASTAGMAKRAGCDFEALVKKCKDGDEDSKRIFDDMANYLALAVSNMSHLLCISNIFLCGDMWRNRELFYDTFFSRLNELSKKPMNFEFIDAINAATGAALMAVEQCIKHMDFGKEDEK